MFPSDLFNIWKYFKISCRIISFFLSLQPGLIVIVKSKKVVVHYRSMRAILPLIIPGPQCRMSPGKDLHKIAVIQHFVRVPAPGPVTSHQQYCRATLQHKQTRPEAHWMLQPRCTICNIYLKDNLIYSDTLTSYNLLHNSLLPKALKYITKESLPKIVTNLRNELLKLNPQSQSTYN